MDMLWSQMYRNFGLCEIQWEIKNHSLLSSFKNWEVCSPNFQLRGYKVTGWNFKLRQVSYPDKQIYVSFQNVRMIADETESQLVNVHCKLYKNNIYGNWDLVKEMKYQGDQFFTHEEVVNNGDYFTSGNPFNSESLLLKIELLVWFPAYPDLAPKFPDLSVQELSQDIFSLCISQFNSDVQLVVGEDNPVSIMSHKAILFARNPKLKRMITRNRESSWFTIDRHNREDACKIMLRFLYSGNMENSARFPSIGVYEIASVYDVHPLAAYFAPDHLSLCSTVEGDAFEVIWTIENFFSTKRIKSPKFENETIGESWQITLYPRSLLDESHVGLHIDIQGTIQKVIWIQLCLRNSQKLITSKIKQGLLTDTSNFIDDMFIERRVLETEENVILIAKFKAVKTDSTFKLDSTVEWNGEQKDTVGASVIKCLPYCEQKNYNQFFEDMYNLYASCEFRDMFFQLGTVNCNINSGILSARCEVLYNHVVRGRRINLSYVIRGERINLRRISQPTVSRLISFLNCCEIDGPLILEETFELYDVAFILHLKTLQVILIQSLKNCLPLCELRELYRIYGFSQTREIYDIVELAERLYLR